MTDFSKLKYIPPDTAEIHDQLRKIRLRMRMSLSAESIVSSLTDLDQLLRELSEKYLICQIYYAQQPEDEYWQRQYESFLLWFPLFKISLQETLSVLIDHRSSQSIAELAGDNVFRITKSLLATSVSSVSSEQQELMQCRLNYVRLIEELGLLPGGFFQPGYSLRRQLTQLDGERRRASFLKFVQAFQLRKEELLQLYLRILVLQRQISHKLGYARITDYLDKERQLVTTVSGSLESNFAHTLRRHFLPIQYELRRQQALRLGMDSLAIWDRWFPTPEGLPAPDKENNNLETIKLCLNDLFDDEADFLLEALTMTEEIARAEDYERINRPSFHFPVSDLPFMAFYLSPEGYHTYQLFYEAGCLCADTAAFRNRVNLFSWQPDREIREVCGVAIETLSSAFCTAILGDQAENAYDIRLIEVVQELMTAAALTLFEQEVFSLANPEEGDLPEIWSRFELGSGISGPPWNDSDNVWDGYGFLLQPALFLYPLQHLSKARAYVRIWSFKPFSRQGAHRLGTALSNLLAGDTARSDQLSQAGFSQPLTDLDLKLAAFNLCDRLQL